jgi:hypothetical protein
VRQGLDEFEEVPKFISDSQVRPWKQEEKKKTK